MQKFIKKAFSMAELMIVMAIIAVIALAMITTIRPQDLEVGYLYLNAYTFIKDACDNVLLDHENMTPAQDFPISPGNLCTALAGYINTTETNCGSAGSIGYNTTTYSTAWRPSLVASNNMKLYISSTTVINGTTHVLLWVDLNGDRKPNRSKWNKHSAPDVVAFDITSGGDVLIVGPPIFDTRYMWARIHYTTDENGKGTFSPKMPFYQAQYRAFNGATVPDDSLSRCMNSFLPASSDLYVSPDKLPTPTITDYDKETCGFIEDMSYSSCTLQLSN